MTSERTARPLEGRSVVVTRPQSGTSALSNCLSNLGARVIHAPMIRFSPPTDDRPLREAVAALSSYDWVIFTSVRGVDFFFQAVEASGATSRDHQCMIGVIGPATRTAVERHGVEVQLVADVHTQEGVALALAQAGVEGAKILIPVGNLSRDVLPGSLRDSGSEVTVVTAYRTEPEAGGIEELRREMESGRIDMLTFTSSSAVVNFADLVDPNPRSHIAAIGPTTSGTAREMGWTISVEADPHTIDGLCASIGRFYAREG